MYTLNSHINTCKWIFSKIYQKYLQKIPVSSHLWEMHPQGKYFIERGGNQIPPPMSCNIILTNICNLRCVICGNQNATGIKRRSMDIEVFRAVANTLFPVLTGIELNSEGEPLLYPYIEEVFATIKKFGCKLKLQSNATLLTPKIINLLCEQTGELSFSVDATGELFDLVRKGGKWENVDRSLRELMKKRDPRKLVIQLYPTITERTLPDMLNVLEWAYELGIDKVMFHRYDPFESSSEVRPTNEAMLVQKEQIRKWLRKHSNTPFVTIDTKLVRICHEPSSSTPPGKQVLVYPNYPQPRLVGHPRYICPTPIQYVDIDLDGNISACCRTQYEKLGKALSIQTFAEAWFGTTYEKIRSALQRNSSIPNPLKKCKICIRDYIFN